MQNKKFFYLIFSVWLFSYYDSSYSMSKGKTENEIDKNNVNVEEPAAIKELDEEQLAEDLEELKTAQEETFNKLRFSDAELKQFRTILNQPPDTMINLYELSDNYYPITDATKKLDFPFYFSVSIKELTKKMGTSLSDDETKILLEILFQWIHDDIKRQSKVDSTASIYELFYSIYEKYYKDRVLNKGPIKDFDKGFINYFKIKLGYFIGYVDLLDRDQTSYQKTFETVINSLPDLNNFTDYRLRTFFQIEKIPVKMGDRIYGVIPIQENYMEWWDNPATQDTFERFYIQWMLSLYKTLDVRIQKLSYPDGSDPTKINFNIDKYPESDFLLKAKLSEMNLYLDNLEPFMKKGLVNLKIDHNYLNIAGIKGILIYSGYQSN